MAVNEAPERVVGSEEHAGRTCPYCRFPLKQGGQLAVCGHCRCAHHADCWDDNGGCAVLACAGGPAKESTAALAGATVGAAAGGGGLAPVQASRQPTEVWPTARVPHGAPAPTAPAPSGGGTGFGTKSLVVALFVLALAVGGFAAALLLSKNKNTVDTAQARARQTTPTSTPTQTVTVQVKDTSNTSQKHTTTPTPRRTTGETTSHHTSPRSIQPTPDPAPARNPDTDAATAIGQYWQDINNGEYQDAVDMETSSEQHNASVSDLESEQPHVNVMSVGQAVPDGPGQATVRVDFYANNTVGNDQTCRHFTIDSLMILSGGNWLYNGHVPGSNTTDETADGDPNCPD